MEKVCANMHVFMLSCTFLTCKHTLLSPFSVCTLQNSLEQLCKHAIGV